MFDVMPKGYNIGWEVVSDKCITTGAVPSSHPLGGYRLQYETLIWEWLGEERGQILEQIVHWNHKEAEKVHGYIVGNLKGVK
ncbi:hypothetical protein [Lentibacillus amyloliquefaciens]|uniref:Uncharacterized protein n=1 Tax=Lentibacillus amyloliquefaciens TaxID=1472767 RepID=A0A0U3WBW6_9BACI|nr:hypothetical protein [Lentibacillus amyloliquefaciens]ALX50434.1 hypothetical protein AOX59_18725 [Lentibacillus amyloliquefaciens]